MEKKEVQENLIKTQNEKVSSDEFLSVLKLVAPGTILRAAIDGALKAGKGGLFVVENDALSVLLDGGFRINCRFTPQRIVELTKMDGAIIISKDLKRILQANVLLTPSSKIKTSETGTRHKAAERTAKQAKTLAIAISERRKEVTLFYKNARYLIKNPSELLRKANEHIQLLETQRELFDNYVSRLNKSEVQNYSNLSLAVTLIQKALLIQKIVEDLRKYTVELGSVVNIFKIRLREIKGGVEKENDYIIKDYSNISPEKSKMLLETLSYEEILDENNIYQALAYEQRSRSNSVRGWRILSKTSLQEGDIAQLIRNLNSLDKILEADLISLTVTIGEEKASKLISELEKTKRENI